MISAHSHLLQLAAFAGATLMLSALAGFWLDQRRMSLKRASLTSPKSQEKSK